jgi:hypothetical protein
MNSFPASGMMPVSVTEGRSIGVGPEPTGSLTIGIIAPAHGPPAGSLPLAR